jgi:hypothetical protein
MAENVGKLCRMIEDARKDHARTSISIIARIVQMQIREWRSESKLSDKNR